MESMKRWWGSLPEHVSGAERGASDERSEPILTGAWSERVLKWVRARFERGLSSALRSDDRSPLRSRSLRTKSPIKTHLGIPGPSRPVRSTMHLCFVYIYENPTSCHNKEQTAHMETSVFRKCRCISIATRRKTRLFSCAAFFLFFC